MTINTSTEQCKCRGRDQIHLPFQEISASFRPKFTSSSLAMQRFFVVFVFVFGTSPLTLFLSRNGYVSSNIFTQLLWVLTYLVTSILLIPYLPRAARIIADDPLISIIVALCTISVFWSQIPLLTFQRSIALAGTTLFAVYLVVRFSMREQITLVGIAMLVAGILSIVLIIVFPEMGIDQVGNRAGTFRGIYHQKAGLGRAMMLGIIALTTLMLNGKPKRWHWMGLIVMGSLMLGSQSRTAIIVCLCLIICLFLYRIFWFRWHFTLHIPFALIILLTIFSGLFILFQYAEPIFESIGRNATMSGRIPLWKDVWAEIIQRPFFGYAYNSYWLGWNGPSSAIWIKTFWEPRYAHNGFLDLALDIGLVGLVVLLCQMIGFLIAALYYARVRRDAIGLWPLIIWTLTILINLTDTTIISQNSTFWALYLAGSYSVHTFKRSRNRHAVTMSTSSG